MGPTRTAKIRRSASRPRQPLSTGRRAAPVKAARTPVHARCAPGPRLYCGCEPARSRVDLELGPRTATVARSTPRATNLPCDRPQRPREAPAPAVLKDRQATEKVRHLRLERPCALESSTKQRAHFSVLEPQTSRFSAQLRHAM